MEIPSKIEERAAKDYEKFNELVVKEQLRQMVYKTNTVIGNTDLDGGEEEFSELSQVLEMIGYETLIVPKDELPPNVSGKIDHEKKKVFISENLASCDKFLVLAHEAAHAMGAHPLFAITSHDTFVTIDECETVADITAAMVAAFVNLPVETTDIHVKRVAMRQNNEEKIGVSKKVYEFAFKLASLMCGGLKYLASSKANG